MVGNGSEPSMMRGSVFDVFEERTVKQPGGYLHHTGPGVAGSPASVTRRECPGGLRLDWLYTCDSA